MNRKRRIEQLRESPAGKLLLDIVENKRPKFEEEEEEEVDIVLGEADAPRRRSRAKGKAVVRGKSKKKRAPSIKSRLLTKLRARRKVVKAELSTLDRDIKSLTCRRKTKPMLE